MTESEARRILGAVLATVAPEADLDEVGEGETMQEAMDLDSVDFLNLVIGLHERTGIEIPERDYPELATVEGCVAYLTSASA